MPSTEALIGVTEAARVLRVDRSTVTRWAKSGRLTPVTKLPHGNGALVFDRSDVDALVGEERSA